METVYPASASALARGRRLRRAAGASRARCRTMPVTFAEIKEVDEESAELDGDTDRSRTGRASVERRRPDVLQPLEAPLGRQFLEFRRRRHRTQLREPDELSEAGAEDKPGDKRTKETIRRRSTDALTDNYEEVIVK